MICRENKRLKDVMLWRRAYETESVTALNSAHNPP